MKRVKKYLFLALVFVVFPLVSFACNETTFEDVPWGSSSQSVEDIVSQVTASKNVMIESGLAVEYKTITTYNFKQTLNNDFQNRVVRDEKTTILSNWNSQNAVAKVENLRYIDNILTETSTEYYVKYQGQTGVSCYLYSENTRLVNEAEVTTYNRENYSTVDNPFLTLLSEIIYDTNITEVSVVSEKVFEEDLYYRLTSEVGELAVVNNKFSENDDIFSNPNLFELYNETEDYVISFNCEYGLNEAEYLQHFALSYNIERSNGVFHERETYLSVNSVTTLSTYGRDVAIPSSPENVDLYTVSGFKDCVSEGDSYITYQDNASGQGLTNEYSVYKKGDDYIFNVRVYNSQTAVGETKHYYASKLNDAFTIYQINVENGTYYDVTSTINPLFLSFDYNLGLVNTDQEEGIYQFGTTESYIEIRLVNGEVYSVKTQNSGALYVVEYGSGMPSDEVFYDIEDFEFVESE